MSNIVDIRARRDLKQESMDHIKVNYNLHMVMIARLEHEVMKLHKEISELRERLK